MKNKFTLLTVIISMAISFSSCKKFLDVKPLGLDVISTIDEYNGLFNNANLYSYYNVRNYPGSATTTLLGYPGMPLMMSDDIFSDSTYLATQVSSYQSAYQWQDNVFALTDEPHDWETFYTQNYIYNVVANGVMSATTGADSTKKQLLAEARANRALLHLMLVNIFAKPYNAATASTDLGVPIVTTANSGNSNFTRPTVKQVYDFIISELNASIPDLPLRTVNRARLAQTAAYYILGLTYFWMNDYPNALSALNNCRNSLSNYTIGASLYDYNSLMSTWITTTSPWLGASKYPSQTLSTENIYLKQMSLNFATARNTLYLKPSIYSLFTSTDQRKKIFYNNSTTNSIIGGLGGQQRNAPVSVNWGPNLADLYLMLAECEARTGDINNAKLDLLALRVKRMGSTDAAVTASTQDAIIKVVLQERLREFAGTGWRWFDMRRLSNDQTYNNIDANHPLNNSTTNYKLRTERLTLKIPPSILAINPGMQDNQ